MILYVKLKFSSPLESSPPPAVLQLVAVPKADSLAISWQPPSTSSNLIVRGYRVAVRDLNNKRDVYNDILTGRVNRKLKLYNGISKTALV